MYPLVEVLWYDAATDHGWEEERDAKVEVHEVLTVGFLIKKSKNGIVIASSIGPEDRSHNSRMTIHKRMIKSIREVDYGRVEQLGEKDGQRVSKKQ